MGKGTVARLTVDDDDRSPMKKPQKNSYSSSMAQKVARPEKTQTLLTTPTRREPRHCEQGDQLSHALSHDYPQGHHDEEIKLVY